MLADVQKAIDRAKEKNPGLKASCAISRGKALCWTGEAIEAERFFPAWVVSEAQPFVRRAIGGMKRSGIPFEIAHFDFCTNASHFCGEAGIPTIGYGPSYDRSLLLHRMRRREDPCRGILSGMCGFARLERRLGESYEIVPASKILPTDGETYTDQTERHRGTKSRQRTVDNTEDRTIISDSQRAAARPLNKNLKENFLKHITLSPERVA